VHHSPAAALAFAPLTLAGVLVGRRLVGEAPPRAFIARAALVAVVGLAWVVVAVHAGVPFNKKIGTSSFVAVATAASAILLLATAALERAGMRFPAWLAALGGNALTAWVLQYVLVYYPAWIVFPAWRRLPLLPGMAAVVAALAVLGALTIALGRRGIRIPI
jgi:predicted acyltransferase